MRRRRVLRCCAKCVKVVECQLDHIKHQPCDSKYGTDDCGSLLESNMCRASRCTRWERKKECDGQQTLFD